MSVATLGKNDCPLLLKRYKEWSITISFSVFTIEFMANQLCQWIVGGVSEPDVGEIRVVANKPE